jgi:hypothetical protein
MPLVVVGLHAAVLLAPALEGASGQTLMANHLLDGPALGQEPVALGKFPDHLLGRVSAILRLCSSPYSCWRNGLA